MKSKKVKIKKPEISDIEIAQESPDSDANWIHELDLSKKNGKSFMKIVQGENLVHFIDNGVNVEKPLFDNEYQVDFAVYDLENNGLTETRLSVFSKPLLRILRPLIVKSGGIANKTFIIKRSGKGTSTRYSMKHIQTKLQDLMKELEQVESGE